MSMRHLCGSSRKSSVTVVARGRPSTASATARRQIASRGGFSAADGDPATVTVVLSAKGRAPASYHPFNVNSRSDAATNESSAHVVDDRLDIGAVIRRRLKGPARRSVHQGDSSFELVLVYLSWTSGRRCNHKGGTDRTNLERPSSSPGREFRGRRVSIQDRRPRRQGPCHSVTLALCITQDSPKLREPQETALHVPAVCRSCIDCRVGGGEPTSQGIGDRRGTEGSNQRLNLGLCSTTNVDSMKVRLNA